MANSFGEQLAGNTRDGRFAGGIDVEHGGRVGIAKRSGEIVEQQLRAGIAVRLEDDVDLSEPAFTRRRKCRAYLGGMVAVVVDHGHVVDAPLELEAAVHSVEFLQTLANLLHRYVESKTDGDGGGGIAHIVLARHVQMKFSQVFAVI